MKPETLLLQTGFEPDVRIAPWKNEARLAGADRSLDEANDLDRFEAGSTQGGLAIQTRGGNEDQRRFALAADPENAANRVLEFELFETNEASDVGPKGRIQCNLYGLPPLTRLTHRVRLRLDDSLRCLAQWDAQPTDLMTNWFILQEYWMGPNWWGDSFPFRISVSLYWNPAEKNRLYFTAHGQPGNPDPAATGYAVWLEATWHEVQRDFEVPPGTWLDCRSTYRMGDADTGRFVFEVAPAGDEWHTIFDITDWTYSPLSPEPVPLQHFNPIKMYTSGEVVAFLRRHDARCRTWWDDLRVEGS